MVKEFKGVTVDVKANVYFEGKVQSRKVFLPDGEKITLGVILPGEYEFPVGEKEIVKLTCGTADVLLPGEEEWKTVEQDKIFTVIANSTYQIKCNEIVEYVCSYIKE